MSGDNPWLCDGDKAKTLNMFLKYCAKVQAPRKYKNRVQGTMPGYKATPRAERVFDSLALVAHTQSFSHMMIVPSLRGETCAHPIITRFVLSPAHASTLHVRVSASSIPDVWLSISQNLPVHSDRTRAKLSYIE